MDLFCSNLPNDADMIQALGNDAIPFPGAFTDCMFSGYGSKGVDILIAVERKKVQDLAKCINDGRYIQQLQICKEMGVEVAVMVIEGEYRPNPIDGLLEIPQWDAEKKRSSWSIVEPAMTYSRFDQYLTELDYLAGVIVKRTWNVKETASVIKALWTNFQDAPEKHQSLKKMFSAPEPHRGVELFRPSLLRRMAKELPGVGWGRSRAVAQHFKNVREMANANPKEWLDIEGIGKITAENVVAEIRGEKVVKKK